MTRTYRFGVSKREGHDSSPYYNRSLYIDNLSAVFTKIPSILAEVKALPVKTVKPASLDWMDHIYCHTAERMVHIPDASIALAFTSPPYNVGKDYDKDISLEAYLRLIAQVATEVYRVLVPGGRYVINIANVGRKPYLPLHALFYAVQTGIGFLPAGEIIWVKGKSQSGSCAWGSWKSAKAPRLRDAHEYLLVFVKEQYGRPDRGESDISRDEFLTATVSIWEIPPESAKRIGHPAPFPIELATRVIKLFSYVNDVVLDPFAGSGSTLVAAKMHQRHYVGYEIVPEYCQIANDRLRSVRI